MLLHRRTLAAAALILKRSVVHILSALLHGRTAVIAALILKRSAVHILSVLLHGRAAAVLLPAVPAMFFCSCSLHIRAISHNRCHALPLAVHVLIDITAHRHAPPFPQNGLYRHGKMVPVWSPWQGSMVFSQVWKGTKAMARGASDIVRCSYILLTRLFRPSILQPQSERLDSCIYAHLLNYMILFTLSYADKMKMTEILAQRGENLI